MTSSFGRRGRCSHAGGGADALRSGGDDGTVGGVEERLPRLSDEDYLKHVEQLANVVCDAAFDEGWLTFGPDDAGQSPLQQAINELARNLRFLHCEGDGCLDELQPFLCFGAPQVQRGQ